MKMPIPKKTIYEDGPFQNFSARVPFQKYVAFKEKAKKDGFSMNRIMEHWITLYIKDKKLKENINDKARDI